MLDFLKQRLGKNYEHLVTNNIIPKEIIANDVSKIITTLQLINYQRVFYKSFENESGAITRKTLLELPVLPGSKVKLIWIADPAGIFINYQLFIENFDDLW
jgi:hypothetical protein